MQYPDDNSVGAMIRAHATARQHICRSSAVNVTIWAISRRSLIVINAQNDDDTMSAA
jgi:hypothetical protein